MKLFKLTTNTKVKFGRTLIQIVATVDFKSVKKGELGGWIEDERSVRDDCWVHRDGEVYKNATIHGGVMHGGVMHGGVMRGGVMRGGVMHGGVMHGGVMHGGVMHGGEMWGGEMHGGEMWGGEMHGGVMSDGNHIGFANVGSENGYLFANIVFNKIMVNRGCFYGSINEFYEAVEKTHGDNEHAEFYKLIRPVIEAKLNKFIITGGTL